MTRTGDFRFTGRTVYAMDRRVSNVCPESWGAILGRWPSPLPPTSRSAPSPTHGPVGARPRRRSPGCRGLDRLRADVARRLPELTRPRKVPAGPAGRHHRPPPRRAPSPCGRCKERRLGGSIKIAGISRRLRVAAEHLGPTYIKLGQILSSGEGIFPEELVAEFKKCRDQVPPEPWDVVERVVEEELGRRHRHRVRRVRAHARWRRRRSPRCTGPRCSTAPTSS